MNTHKNRNNEQNTSFYIAGKEIRIITCWMAYDYHLLDRNTLLVVWSGSLNFNSDHRPEQLGHSSACVRGLAVWSGLNFKLTP